MMKKPCPFCDSLDLNECKPEEDFVVLDGYTVDCTNCGASGPPARTMSRAVEKWNDRAAKIEKQQNREAGS